MYIGGAHVRMPADSARALASALTAQAARAETVERFEDPKRRKALMDDQKILNEAGCGLNLGVPRSVLRQELSPPNDAWARKGVPGMPTLTQGDPKP